MPLVTYDDGDDKSIASNALLLHIENDDLDLAHSDITVKIGRYDSESGRFADRPGKFIERSRMDLELNDHQRQKVLAHAQELYDGNSAISREPGGLLHALKLALYAWAADRFGMSVLDYEVA